MRTGLLYIIAGSAFGIVGLISSFYDSTSIMFVIIGVFFAVIGVILATTGFDKKIDITNETPKNFKEGGTFQLKAGEKLLKKGQVDYGNLGNGVLYLTDQRLFTEYFKYEMLAKIYARSIEIPLSEITNVGRTSHFVLARGLIPLELKGDVKVEYRYLGEQAAIVFSSNEGVLGTNKIEVNDQWASQIQKAAEEEKERKQA